MKVYSKIMPELNLEEEKTSPKRPLLEGSQNFPVTMPDGTAWPRITIVTPSYNQGIFLEETIRSVLLQGYPNLEYIIIDGSSTDDSVEIIKKYEPWLSYWVSEPDKGQYDAINKGFARASGEVLAWINSDDKYVPWAFQIVGEIFSTLPEVGWLTTLTPLIWDRFGRVVTCNYRRGYNRDAFFYGEFLPGADWHTNGCIQQESTFWRRSLWEKAGGYVDTSLSFASDFELWARFYKFEELFVIRAPLGGFRIHGDQKTSHHFDTYLEEAKSAFFRHDGNPPSRVRSFFRKLFPYIPRRIAMRLGILYPCKICEYNNSQNDWKISTIWWA